MNSPRRLLTKIAFAATLLFAVANPAQAVRPYSPKVTTPTYHRYTQTALLAYTKPETKGATIKRAVPYLPKRQNLSPLKSWSGLGFPGYRVRGDISAYGAVRTKSQLNRDIGAVRRNGIGKLHLATSPLSIR
jgi:hypothetical protein